MPRLKTLLDANRIKTRLRQTTFNAKPHQMETAFDANRTKWKPHLMQAASNGNLFGPNCLIKAALGKLHPGQLLFDPNRLLQIALDQSGTLDQLATYLVQLFAWHL